MITRTLAGDEFLAYGQRLLRLQHAAYEVEAQLIGDNRIPPLHENESELLASGLCWTATFEGPQLVGAVGYTIENGVTDIDRLVVDPQHQRRGIATELVTNVMTLAEGTVVSTGKLNAPARRLYEKLGFTHQRDVEAIPDMWISQYSRSSANSQPPPQP